MKAILILLLFTAVLIFTVTRVTNVKSVLNLPKAAERQVVSTWELIYGNKTASNSDSSTKEQSDRVSTAELIFRKRNASPSAVSTPTPTHTVDGNYKSAVTANGNFANFTVTNDGTIIKDFADRFDVPDCNLKNYVVKGPSIVSVTSGNFSFSQNGFIVSGTLASVTSRLENYPISECGSGAKINAGPFTYQVSWQGN